MFPIIKNKTAILTKKILASFSIICFLFNLIIPVSFAQSIAGLNLPIPGEMVSMSPVFQPAIMKGITVNPDNPLLFDFLIDIGQSKLDDEAFKEESTKLIKYFLASLTVPEEELWVNLSPYEDDRIIPDMLGETEMGRDLLGQDYVLKQLTASLLFPENDLGSSFWSRVYEKTYAQFGTTDIPINTFNKIWIVPEKAVVYEHNNTAFIAESHLKVMLESDYVALNKSMGIEQFGLDSMPETDAQDVSSLATQVIKEIVIPEIEREVNEGQNFANLRQIYQSMILSSWYKIALRESLLGQVYADQNKTKGIDLEDKQVKFKIYDQYLKAFNKGVYDFIKEDYDPKPQDVVYRKYISGGVDAAQLGERVSEQRVTSPERLTLVQQQEVERAVAEDSSVRRVEAGMTEISRSNDPKYADYVYEEVNRAVSDQTRVTAPSKEKGFFGNGGVSGSLDRRTIITPISVEQAVQVYQDRGTPMTVFNPNEANETSPLKPIYTQATDFIKSQGLSVPSGKPIVLIATPANEDKRFGVARVNMRINGIDQEVIAIERPDFQNPAALTLDLTHSLAEGPRPRVQTVEATVLKNVAEGSQRLSNVEPAKLTEIQRQTRPIADAFEQNFGLEDTGRATNPEISKIKANIRNAAGGALERIAINKLKEAPKSSLAMRVRNIESIQGAVQEADFGKNPDDGVAPVKIGITEMPKIMHAGFVAQTLDQMAQLNLDHVVLVSPNGDIRKVTQQDLESSRLTGLVTVSKSPDVERAVGEILKANSKRPGKMEIFHLTTPDVVGIETTINPQNPTYAPLLNNKTVNRVDYMETPLDALAKDEKSNIEKPVITVDGYSPLSTADVMAGVRERLSPVQRPGAIPLIGVSKPTLKAIENPTTLAVVTNLPEAVERVRQYRSTNPNDVVAAPIQADIEQIGFYLNDGKTPETTKLNVNTLNAKTNQYVNTFNIKPESGGTQTSVKDVFEFAGNYKTTANQAPSVPQTIKYQVESSDQKYEVSDQEVGEVHQALVKLSPSTRVALRQSISEGRELPKRARLDIFENAPNLVKNEEMSEQKAAIVLHAVSPQRNIADKTQLSQQPLRFASTNPEKSNVLLVSPRRVSVQKVKVPKSEDRVGGINLNPKLLDLQIKRDGDGIPLPLNQQPLNDMKIDGFLPFIIQITPVTDLQLLLGINPEVNKETELSKAG